MIATSTSLLQQVQSEQYLPLTLPVEFVVMNFNEFSKLLQNVNMVGSTHLDRVTFPVIVTQCTFSLLHHSPYQTDTYPEVVLKKVYFPSEYN